MQAAEYLSQAQSEMRDRATTYDSAAGERSMAATVAMFNALTGNSLTEEQGWKFMVCLKLVRSEQGDFRADNFVDGAAYFGLAGETAANQNAPTKRVEDLVGAVVETSEAEREPAGGVVLCADPSRVDPFGGW